MSDPVQDANEGWKAAETLSKLVKRDLGKKVSAGELMIFIKKRWATIAPLAHAVHEAPDHTKGGVAAVSDQNASEGQS